MSEEVTCPPCGEVLSVDNDDDLVTMVQDHAKKNHGSDLEREHILATAREV